ncbi:MAG: sensor histidine kinase, partial [Nitrospiria bacterium]
QEQLVASETMVAIGEMTSVVAHGIRNPLASIRSTAELALDEQTLSKEPAEDIVAEADRLEAWVRELLAYSRPASDKWVPLEINRVMKAVLKGFERDLEKHGIQHVLNLEEPPPMINAEESFLRHVIANIFSNAIEAMPNGGLLTITIRTNAKREHIEIIIEDTGIGISNEQIKKMFKPFFTTKPKGLGVGLSLAKRIIERHGGTIQVASKKNKGTTVTMTIPVSR